MNGVRESYHPVTDSPAGKGRRAGSGCERILRAIRSRSGASVAERRIALHSELCSISSKGMQRFRSSPISSANCLSSTRTFGPSNSSAIVMRHGGL